MSDRRHYPRLNTHVLWRSTGLGGPRQPALDASEGGLRVYSDESVALGTRLELELLGPDGVTVKVLARVVRVDALPPKGPARFDVAVEFLEVREDARRQLVRLGVIAEPAPSPQARIEEHEPEQIKDVEQQHRDDGLLQASSSVLVARGPDGNGHVGEQNGHQESLLHSLPRSGARPTIARNGRHGSKWKVLFVTPYLPSPPRFGGQMRMHGLISGLARDNDVSVLSLIDPNEEQGDQLRATREYCTQVTAVENSRHGKGTAAKRLLQLGSVVSSRSYEWLLHREPALDAALDRLVKTERYDVVHFEFPHMAAYRMGRGPRSVSDPVFLLDEHNIEHDIVRQTAALGASPLRRAFSALNGRKMHTEEKNVWAGLDGCTMTSARDQAMLLAEAPHTRTVVIPNGVDLDYFRPAGEPPPSRESPSLLFFGAIDYHPNTDGLLYFFKEILPLLADRVPRVSFCVAGRKPPESIVAYRGPNVEITGCVDDLRPYIARAAVVVVPLRIGGGTRLKILEAMAMGKAIVSTTLGAEGLSATDGVELLIADDPKSFAAQVRRLLDDPALAARLGAAAQRFVSERYSWRGSVDKLSAFYSEVVEARQQPRPVFAGAASPGALSID